MRAHERVHALSTRRGVSGTAVALHDGGTSGAQMRDRRRTTRYVLGEPLRGDAMPMEDVTVEKIAGERVVVISPSAHALDEQLMIHMTTADGLQSLPARVVASNPISVGGALCFRVELRVDEERPPSRGEGQR